MKPLKSNQIKGNWATVMLPINEDDSIDYGRLKNEVETIIAYGVDGLYTNGTAGEFHNQTEAEFDRISELIAGLCNNAQMPFQIGVSHMSPVISRERLRRIVDLKPSAVQVIFPDWVFPNPKEELAFLEGMADVAGEIGIVIYNPPHAKKRLTPEEFGELRRQVPTFRGVKVAGDDEEWFRQVRESMESLSVFIAGHRLAFGIQLGAHGAYSNVAALHPLAAQDWYNMMTNDLETAVDIGKRIKGFLADYVLPYSQQGYSNTALDKLLAAVGQWADIGTRLRWPYQFLPAETADALRDPFCKAVPEFEPYIRGSKAPSPTKGISPP